MFRYSPLIFRNLPIRKPRRKEERRYALFSYVVIAENEVAVKPSPALVGRNSRLFIYENQGGALWHQ